MTNTEGVINNFGLVGFLYINKNNYSIRHVYDLVQMICHGNM